MNEIIFGDCTSTLRALHGRGIRAQMCVTSPPYFGLRSYLPDESPDKTQEIGLEDTPERYIERMVEVFRCVRDVLADDGTLWLNIGDSYAANGGKTQPHRDSSGGIGNKGTRGEQGYHAAGGGFIRPNTVRDSLKPKDLIGIPWLLAFALRADGWYLRQEIIWHKPNPMPESVTDRCTKAHESIFLLAKSERYFYDSGALREEAVGKTLHDLTGPGYKAPGQAPNLGNRKALRTDIESRHRSQIKGGQSLMAKPDGKRNKRSVWTVPTKPFSGAHFAVFPPALIEPCILAGSRPGDIVLDPFMGSGTTAAVAIQHGRQYLGCELNPEYQPLQQARIRDAHASAAQQSLFAEAG